VLVVSVYFVTSKMRRTMKNVVYNFSDAQIKVREATSNDPWGPSSTLMSEIADLTYNVVAFTEIMQMVWKRLNDHGKNWRHVYKALVLLDYIIKTGSEKVAQQCRENIYAIETLKDFQMVEETKDQGVNVREKAKQLSMLLKDDERLRNERTKALKAKERFAQNSMGIGSTSSHQVPTSTPAGPKDISSRGGGGAEQTGDSYQTMSRDDSDTEEAAVAATEAAGAEPGADGSPGNPELESVRPSTLGEEELQLQLALAMSKEEHEEEKRKTHDDDVRLQLALEESRKNGEPIPEETLLSLMSRTGASSAHAPDAFLALGGGAQAAASDPWSPAPPPAAVASNDPWGASPPRPPPSKSNNDPWSSSPPRAAPAADPWAPSPPTVGMGSSVSPVPAASLSGGSGWPDMQPTTNGGPQHNGRPGNALDDAFDMLGTRSTTNTTSDPSLDLFAGSSVSSLGGGNPYDMSGMGDVLMGSSSTDPYPGKSKTAESFLGAHASLVSLDNLVSQPAPQKAPNVSATLNPFGSVFDQQQNTSSSPAVNNNPFGAVNNSGPARVPMNQMASSSSMGFPEHGRTVSPLQHGRTVSPLPMPLLNHGAPTPPPVYPVAPQPMMGGYPGGGQGMYPGPPQPAGPPMMMQGGHMTVQGGMGYAPHMQPVPQQSSNPFL